MRYSTFRSRSARLATTATVCGSPYDTGKLSTWKSAASRPTTDTGSSGSSADSADGQRERDVLRELGLDQASSSGKLKPLSQSSGSHSSSGSIADAVSHVVISGVKPSVPYASCMCESMSPLVVYSSAEMSGS